MKRIMKAVRPSYLHLSNILSGRIRFSGRVIESSFSTRLECSGSTSQPDSTLFQKNSNSTRHFSSRVLDSNSNTRLDAISLSLYLLIYLHVQLSIQLLTRLSNSISNSLTNFLLYLNLYVCKLKEFNCYLQ